MIQLLKPTKKERKKENTSLVSQLLRPTSTLNAGESARECEEKKKEKKKGRREEREEIFIPQRRRAGDLHSLQMLA